MKKITLVAAAAALIGAPALAQSQVLGAWDTTIEAAGGVVYEATLTFSETEDGYALDFDDADPEADAIVSEVKDLEVTGNAFSFTRTLELSAFGGDDVDVYYEGEVENDALTASASSLYGPADLFATRIPETDE
ncbi:MAG: hypothetical protein PVI23_10195 [Maricaulaceae bacterium]|jgi:hypothetical protein